MSFGELQERLKHQQTVASKYSCIVNFFQQIEQRKTLTAKEQNELVKQVLALAERAASSNLSLNPPPARLFCLDKASYAKNSPSNIKALFLLDKEATVEVFKADFMEKQMIVNLLTDLADPQFSAFLFTTDHVGSLFTLPEIKEILKTNHHYSSDLTFTQQQQLASELLTIVSDNPTLVSQLTALLTSNGFQYSLYRFIYQALPLIQVATLTKLFKDQLDLKHAFYQAFLQHDPVWLASFSSEVTLDWLITNLPEGLQNDQAQPIKKLVLGQLLLEALTKQPAWVKAKLRQQEILEAFPHHLLPQLFNSPQLKLRDKLALAQSIWQTPERLEQAASTTYGYLIKYADETQLSMLLDNKTFRQALSAHTIINLIKEGKLTTQQLNLVLADNIKARQQFSGEQILAAQNAQQTAVAQAQVFSTLAAYDEIKKTWLRHVTFDDAWNTLGQGFFAKKVPTTIAQARSLFEAADASKDGLTPEKLQAIIELYRKAATARAPLFGFYNARHPSTQAFYNKVAALPPLSHEEQPTSTLTART